MRRAEMPKLVSALPQDLEAWVYLLRMAHEEEALKAGTSWTHYQDRNLKHQLARFWGLPALRAAQALRAKCGELLVGVPTLELGYHKRTVKHRGSAWPQRQHLRIAIYPDASMADIMATLLHEALHCALPNAEGHSTRFWWYLQLATQQAWYGLEFEHSLLFGRMSARNARHVLALTRYEQQGGLL